MFGLDPLLMEDPRRINAASSIGNTDTLVD